MEATLWDDIGGCTLESSSGTYVQPHCVEIPVTDFASGTNDYVFMTKTMIGDDKEDVSYSSFSVM